MEPVHIMLVEFARGATVQHQVGASKDLENTAGEQPPIRLERGRGGLSHFFDNLRPRKFLGFPLFTVVTDQRKHQTLIVKISKAQNNTRTFLRRHSQGHKAMHVLVAMHYQSWWIEDYLQDDL